MSKSIQGRSNAIDRASVIDGAFDTLSNKPNASTPLPNEPKAPSPRTRSRAKGAFTLRRNRPGAPTTTLYQAKGAPHSLRSKAKAHSTRCRASRTARTCPSGQRAAQRQCRGGRPASRRAADTQAGPRPADDGGRQCECPQPGPGGGPAARTFHGRVPGGRRAARLHELVDRVFPIHSQ